MPREMLLTVVQRLRFQRCRHGVVPAIEESEQRDDADDLNDLIVGEMLLKVLENVVCDFVWSAAGSYSKIDGCAFCGAEQRTVLVIPNSIKLRAVDL